MSMSIACLITYGDYLSEHTIFVPSTYCLIFAILVRLAELWRIVTWGCCLSLIVWILAPAVAVDSC
jgi:hypothetical protein